MQENDCKDWSESNIGSSVAAAWTRQTPNTFAANSFEGNISDPLQTQALDDDNKSNEGIECTQSNNHDKFGGGIRSRCPWDDSKILEKWNPREIKYFVQVSMESLMEERIAVIQALWNNRLIKEVIIKRHLGGEVIQRYIHCDFKW